MIAEFMLHRTRAEQVVPVYLEFIKKYPDIFSLADADFRDVQKVTRHLGLHWRSRHFIEASRFVVEKLNGKFPETYNELRKIPGVGEYIAGAIMVVSFSKPAPVVDSNIARFINRFWNLNLSGELRRKKEIIKIAGTLFSCREPGKFLFAIVDFTSLICKPGKPECGNCPLKDMCRYIKKSSKNNKRTNETVLES
jgi:A/G-specific adenine glycosylase